MKKLFLTLVLMNMSFISAQQNRVGVNTDNPAATLDVEGTVRLAEPGEPTSTDIIKPLGINPTSKKLEKLETSTGDPFEHKRIVRDFQNSPNNKSSYKKIFNLNIDNPNNYEVVLLSSQLSTVDGVPVMAIYSVADGQYYREYGGWYLAPDAGINNTFSPVIILNSNEGDRLASSAITNRDGKARPHILQGKLTKGVGDAGPGASNLIMFGISNSRVYQTANGSWYFEGGYEYSSTLNQARLKWTIDILIINKNWIKTENKSLTTPVTNP